jgi:hypothetical protein
MSVPPKRQRNAQETQDNILGIIKEEAEIDIVSRDVEKSIAELTKRFKQSYEKSLSDVESTIAKHIANAEVRLTRNGETISESYREYLDKINSIHTDVANAKSKAEVKEIKNTIKTYKSIVKDTKALSKEEKKELNNIIKETENAAKIVRSSKLSNTRIITNSIKNNLPDIAGITTAIFGDSVIPAFVGGVVGDYMRAKKEIRKQEEEKRQQLLKDERDFNIKRSVEMRKFRNNEMSEKEKTFRKYTLTRDTGALNTKRKGFLGRRLDMTPERVKSDLAIKRNVGIGLLSRLPDFLTKKNIKDKSQENNVELLTGRDLTNRVLNENRINAKINPLPIDTEPKKLGRPKGSKNKPKSIILPDDIETSVYDGVYDSIKKLSDEGYFIREDKKETQFKRRIERFEQKSKDSKEKLEQRIKEKKEKELAKEQLEILRKNAEDTEHLLQIESHRRIKALLSFVANERENMGKLLSNPLRWVGKFDISKKLSEKFGLDNKADWLEGKLSKLFEWGPIKGFLSFFEDAEAARHKKMMEINEDILDAIKGISSSVPTELIDIFKNGITTIPFDYGTISPTDDKILMRLKEIEDENRVEADYLARMLECMRCDSAETIDNDTGKLIECKDCIQDVQDKKLINVMDDVRAGLGLSWEDSKEKSINDEEERTDALRRYKNMLDSVQNIYKLLDERLDGKKHKSGSSSLDPFKAGRDMIQNAKDIVFGDAQNSAFETVNLSDETIQALCKCMDDDGVIESAMDFMPKSWKRKLKGKAGGIFKKGKGALKKIIPSFLKGGAVDVAETVGTKTLVKGGASTLMKGILGAAGGGIIMDIVMPSELADGTLEGNLQSPYVYDGWDKKIQETQEIQEMKENIDESKQQEQVNNISNAVSSVNTVVGGSTTNINIPILPHDNDIGTRELIHALSA